MSRHARGLAAVFDASCVTSPTATTVRGVVRDVSVSAAVGCCSMIIRQYHMVLANRAGSRECDHHLL